MITPFFTVDQDDEFVLVSIKVSHVRFSAQSTEMVINSDVFIFSLLPYYLRLRLPYLVVDDERAKADFDLQSSQIHIKLPKETKGQHFPDLDLTAKLLARKEESANQTPQTKPLIEELDVTNSISETTSNNLPNPELHDWEVKQEIALEVPSTTITYGFNKAYNQMVGVSLSNGNDINELSNPEAAPENERILERLIKENVKFDPEYYAADYIMQKHPSPDDDKDYSAKMTWKSPATSMFINWYKSQRTLSEGEREALPPVQFTAEEQERMLQLPRKSYLIEDDYKPQLWAAVTSFLFGVQFDLRENEGEHNIESAWTVGRLCPQIAYLDSKILIPTESPYSLLRAAIITGIRRSLCFPFHRHFSLALKAWNDVYYTLRGGKRMVLKVLLDLRELFRYHDVYYVYDKIWMEDLCLWILNDSSTEGAIRELAHSLKRELDTIQKDEITFEKADEGEGDELTAISIADIEEMADESYSQAFEG